ncbi:glycosyl transferase, family 2 [hydrocarbon metagenome]|uniref:Glycosyl transferase, family 2 n=1 Tax=hydrocarbon metagenome TaxID=938273 RepID=A0A0W8FTB3_9ZZZZ
MSHDAVNKLYDFCNTNEAAGIVCGHLLNADGSKQNSIASFPRILTLATNTSLLAFLFPRRFPSKRYKHTFPIEVNSAIGACMMIRKKHWMKQVFLMNVIFSFLKKPIRLTPCA